MTHVTSLLGGTNPKLVIEKFRSAAAAAAALTDDYDVLIICLFVQTKKE